MEFSMLRTIRLKINKISRDVQGGQFDKRTASIVVLMILCIVAPLDLSQLVFMLVGAVAYAGVQALPPPLRRPAAGGSSHHKAAAACYSGVDSYASPTPSPSFRQKHQQHPSHFRAGAKPAQQVAPRRQARLAPADQLQQQQAFVHLACSATTEAATSWNSEVEELAQQLAPGPGADAVVDGLVRSVRTSLSRLLPEAEVLGFATGDLACGSAFGVAVPEVNIVAVASPDALIARLQGTGRVSQLDMRKLQKSAVRVCTHRLVHGGSFKFRRSAFRGNEPKVTLLAPADVGIHSHAIAFDFAINTTTPLHNAAVLTECGQIDPRAKALSLLVKRWAKDRGVIHAAKGHLSPYTWTLLAIYFLQVGISEEEGGPLLPPFRDFVQSSGLAGAEAANVAEAVARQRRPRHNEKPKRIRSKAAHLLLGTLFKRFVRFYYKEFDFDNEVVSVRTGRRAPPSSDLPPHMIEDDANMRVGLQIEDPFDPTHNLGDSMTFESFTRLREELLRADELLSKEASLATLLEPWCPPDAGEKNTNLDEDGDAECSGKIDCRK